MNYLTKYAVNNFVFKNKFVRYNPPYRATQSFELYSLNQSVIFTILRLLIAQESALHSFPISALSLFLYSFTSSSLPLPLSDVCYLAIIIYPLTSYVDLWSLMPWQPLLRFFLFWRPDLFMDSIYE